MQKRDIIRQLFQIAHNVRGDQHGMVWIARKVGKHFDDLIANDRIQSSRRLVEQQKLRPVRKCRRDAELHFGSARQFTKRLFFRNCQHIKIVCICGGVPLSVNIPQHTADLHRIQALWHSDLIQHNADVLPHARKSRRVHILSKHTDRPRILFDHAEDQAHGRALSCAVFADQTHDAAVGQR